MMILFDMLCIFCKFWEICNSLIDIMKTKMEVKLSKFSIYSGDDKKKTDSRIQWIFSLVDKFDFLFQLVGDIDLIVLVLQKDVFIVLYKYSIQIFLQIVILFFLKDDCLFYVNLLIEMKKVIERIEYVFQLYGKMFLEGYIYKFLKVSLGFSFFKVSFRDSFYSSFRFFFKIEDFIQIDKSVFYNVMKFLIYVMQREVFKGGVCTLLIGQVF